MGKKCIFLKSFLLDSWGIDLGFTGSMGLASIKERIDKVVADHFGFAQTDIKCLELYLERTYSNDGGDDTRRQMIMDNLRIQKTRMELILCQKSREVWLKEGDKNSKFFHMSLMMRRRRNNIFAIKDDKRWIQDKNEKCAYFEGKFKELYKSDYPFILMEVEGFGCKYVIDQENEEIVSPFRRGN